LELQRISYAERGRVTTPFSTTVKLLDMLGRVVIEKQANIQSGKTALNVGNLTTGVYLFRISNGKKFGFAKVVISN